MPTRKPTNSELNFMDNFELAKVVRTIDTADKFYGMKIRQNLLYEYYSDLS